MKQQEKQLVPRHWSLFKLCKMKWGGKTCRQVEQIINYRYFFKMQHDLTPAYLTNLVPPSVSETSRYNLPNADDYATIHHKTQYHYSSFLPSVVREWNSLPQQAKQIYSLNSFKAFLIKL